VETERGETERGEPERGEQERRARRGRDEKRILVRFRDTLTPCDNLRRSCIRHFARYV
jgi:hypothetical protein